MKPITVLCTAPSERTQRALAASGLVSRIIALSPAGAPLGASALHGIEVREIETTEPGSASLLAQVLSLCDTPLLLEVVGDMEPHPSALVRMATASRETGAALVYGDYCDLSPDGVVSAHPLADYQAGSLEDAFAFGPLRLWSISRIREAYERHGAVPEDLVYHAWYDTRLKAAETAPIVRLGEPLGTLMPADRRASGQRVFDYLTATRERQIEAERVATAHLTRIGALLRPPFLPFDPEGDWPVEASVVIPVRNRVRTVIDAVNSALSQETTFTFNVIVVDNHSTDGTSEALRKRASEDSRLVVVTPDRQDLGIGGCWNVAVFHPSAGRYVVQLDSDDLYQGKETLARMVSVLRTERCGLCVGSYTLVNMKLEPIPPGLIDHREWTDDNGPNNALRIGGLGAPRAYATALLRQHPFPNASYGEDYAAVLRVSRTYKVGRIYDSLYLCRRWEDNSDADLNPLTKSRFQMYKDRLRTLEILARKNLAGGGSR